MAEKKPVKKGPQKSARSTTALKDLTAADEARINALVKKR
jgi:hypothetical protein